MELVKAICAVIAVIIGMAVIAYGTILALGFVITYPIQALILLVISAMICWLIEEL